MSYYTEKQFIKSGKDKEKTSVLFQTYFSDVKGKILDAGCSVGSFLSLAPDRIQGIDFDEESVNICKKKGLKAEKMDLTKKLKFNDEEFNGVFSSYLIEHIEKPLPMLKELRRILKKNGKLVIITNDWVRTHETKNCNFYDDYTHVKPFTKVSMEKIAFDAGFRNFFVEYVAKGFTGLGWVIRKGFFTTKQIIGLLKIMRFFGITDDSIVLVAYK